MPELPEVENLVQQLRPKLRGKTIESVWLSQKASLLTPREQFRRYLPGSSVKDVRRRGKFMEIILDGPKTLWLHLGMSGQVFCAGSVPESDPHVHFKAGFRGSDEKFFLRDVRRFGKLFLSGGAHDIASPGLKSLGPDPLEVDADVFIDSMKSRKGRIKSLLMNQRFLAGIGNIYADESLHRAGVDPRKQPCRLSRNSLARLHASIRETLSEAIACGGSSIDDYLHVNGCQGSFQEKHRVYGREGKECFSCGSMIRMVRIAGRSSSFCPNCQK